MSFRRAIMALVFCLFTGPAVADDYVATVVSELQSQGYDRIVVEYTLLGRVQIQASRSDISREVVLNPRTGEILRDLRTRTGKGSNNKHDDDEDDDDQDDDGDDDRDNDGDDNDGDNDGDKDGDKDGDRDNSGSGGGGDGDD